MLFRQEFLNIIPYSSIEVVGLIVFTLFLIKKYSTLKWALLIPIVYLPAIINSIIVYFIIKVSVLTGLIIYAINFGNLFLMIAVIKYNWTFRAFKNFDVEDSLAFIHVVLLIIGILFFLFKNNNITTESLSSNRQEINLESVKLSFENIQNKYLEINSTISNETKNLEIIIQETLEKIDGKKKEFEEIKVREKELVDQLEYYKSLASLSKQQAQSILNEMHRNKYLDYIMGAVLGFLTSLLVAFLTNKGLRKNFSFSQQKAVK